MSMMRKRAVLICECCNEFCNVVSGGYIYFHGTIASDFGITDVDSSGHITWSEGGYDQQHRCYRLLVYEGVTTSSDDIATMPSSPNYVLATNKTMQSHAAGELQFREDGPDSGTLLDYPPYWYNVCQRGGRALSTVGQEPTMADINALWAGNPIANGTYTMLVQVMCRRRYSRPGYSAIPPEEGQYMITRIYLFA